jgi:nucleoside-diphosphate-sugar epimerase
MSGRVLIAGASGIVGTAAVDAFLDAGWDVIAVSRRAPETAGRRDYRHLALDLRDETACRSALSSLTGISHVVFAALAEKPGLIAGWSDPAQMALNLDLLRHCIDPLVASGQPLAHVSLLQGTKAYGQHLHPMPVPARENAPRDPHANFYWLQEDYVRALAAECGFSFTILRPQMIIGGAYGVAMNTVPVIGIYAAICREEGLPFGFPGGPPFVWEAVDTRIVARALVWAARSEAARGETFNVTNGDVFAWRHLWPALADMLGLEPGPERPFSMARFLPGKAGTWERIVARHGLRPLSLEQLLGESHHVADFCFGYGAAGPIPPMFTSTIKIRQAGFHEVCDTEESYRFWLADLAARRILPDPRRGG